MKYQINVKRLSDQRWEWVAEISTGILDKGVTGSQASAFFSAVNAIALQQGFPAPWL